MNNHSLTNQRALVNKLFLAGIIFIVFVLVFTIFQEANAESDNHLKKVAAKRMQF